MTAREQQVCDVGARDQQDEDDGTAQQPQRRTDVPGEHLLERRRGELFPGPERHGKNAAEFPCGVVDLERGGPRRRRGPEPRGDVDGVRVIAAEGIRLQRQPEVRRRIGDEAPRHDADHFVCVAAERQRAPDDVRVAGEAALPHPGTDDRHVRPVRTVFVARERPAERQRRAEHGEVAARYVHRVDVLGQVAAEEVRAGIARLIRGDRLEGGRLVAPQDELRDRGQPRRADARRGHELEEAIGLRIGERPQQHGVDDGEDRGVRADADGEHGERGQRESRRPPQHAARVDGVACEVSEDPRGLPPGAVSSKRLAVLRRAYEINHRDHRDHRDQKAFSVPSGVDSDNAANVDLRPAPGLTVRP